MQQTSFLFFLYFLFLEIFHGMNCRYITCAANKYEARFK